MKHLIFMIKFYICSPSNFADDDPDRPKHKEEKKRRSSVFSKLGSYRQKKVSLKITVIVIVYNRVIQY